LSMDIRDAADRLNTLTQPFKITQEN